MRLSSLHIVGTIGKAQGTFAKFLLVRI